MACFERVSGNRKGGSCVGVPGLPVCAHLDSGLAGVRRGRGMVQGFPLPLPLLKHLGIALEVNVVKRKGEGR